MCGRYTVTSPGAALREVAEAFGARVDAVADQAELRRPRWNIAPTQLVPVVQWRDGEPVPLVTLARWGLVRPREPAPQINVRRETLGGGRAAALVRQGRALVLADGFYEWRTDGAAKVPIWFSPRRPVWLAGLLDVAELRGVPTLCAAIVTRPPAPLVAPVHDRMPAVLDRDVARAWLDPGHVRRGRARAARVVARPRGVDRDRGLRAREQREERRRGVP